MGPQAVAGVLGLHQVPDQLDERVVELVVGLGACRLLPVVGAQDTSGHPQQDAEAVDLLQQPEGEGGELQAGADPLLARAQLLDRLLALAQRRLERAERGRLRAGRRVGEAARIGLGLVGQPHER